MGVVMMGVAALTNLLVDEMAEKGVPTGGGALWEEEEEEEEEGFDELENGDGGMTI
jgi:hypothetical protein